MSVSVSGTKFLFVTFLGRCIAEPLRLDYIRVFMIAALPVIHLVPMWACAL